MKPERTIFYMLALLCASCAPDPVDVTKCIQLEPDGFWLGLWHGWISPITFIISLFTDTVDVYSKNNSGGWYDFGFLVGAGVLFGCTSRSK